MSRRRAARRCGMGPEIPAVGRLQADSVPASMLRNRSLVRECVGTTCGPDAEVSEHGWPSEDVRDGFHRLFHPLLTRAVMLG